LRVILNKKISSRTYSTLYAPFSTCN
jgi:hypothetical protein